MKKTKQSSIMLIIKVIPVWHILPFMLTFTFFFAYIIDL
jgi:flagellar basal body-associated protein FliL